MPTQSDPDAAATAAAKKPRAAIVFNPSKEGVAELKKSVRAAEKRHGWAASVWLETEVDDPGRGMVK